jgi:hypothetical protein
VASASRVPPPHHGWSLRWCYYLKRKKIRGVSALEKKEKKKKKKKKKNQVLPHDSRTDRQ